jgi:hypothetical protein
MIVLVTGGREYKDRNTIYRVLDAVHAARRITYLMHGNARNADRIAHKWALSRGVQPVAFEALWDFEGDAAGTRRNKRMLEFVRPDRVIAFPGGRGTANMMRIAYDEGIEVEDVQV